MPPPLANRIVTYLAKTSGRDKVMRVMQFFFRFMKGIILKIREKTGDSKKYDELVKKLDSLSSNFSLTRRLLRFGRTLGYTLELIKMIKDYNSRDGIDYFNKNNHFFMYFLPKLISNLMSIIQFHMDHLLYLYKIKVYTNHKAYKIMDDISNWTWLIDIILSLLYEGFEIFLLKKKADMLKSKKINKDSYINGKTNTNLCNEELVNSEKEISNINSNIKDLKVDCLKMLFDFPVSYYYCNEDFCHIMWVGLTGTIASLIGAYQAWS